MLPTGLLRYTPLLTHLSLEYARDNVVAGSNVGLPADLLVPVPHLKSLAIANRLPAEELVPLLAHLPRLTHLNVGSYTALPETLLEGVPRLPHLELRDIHDPDLPANLLVPVPHLESRHLESRRSPGYSAPASYSASVPGLILRLSHVPRLTRLTVDGLAGSRYRSGPWLDGGRKQQQRVAGMATRCVNSTGGP